MKHAFRLALLATLLAAPLAAQAMCYTIFSSASEVIRAWYSAPSGADHH